MHVYSAYNHSSSGRQYRPAIQHLDIKTVDAHNKIQAARPKSRHLHLAANLGGRSARFHCLHSHQNLVPRCLVYLNPSCTSSSSLSATAAASSSGADVLRRFGLPGVLVEGRAPRRPMIGVSCACRHPDTDLPYSTLPYHRQLEAQGLTRRWPGSGDRQNIVRLQVSERYYYCRLHALLQFVAGTSGAG